ncbi:hypothetical protein TNCV_765381 [Trichonephila clavipes]|nr:hypothetical protein TNCV_765381 [Trichonephila clavipes]
MNKIRKSLASLDCPLSLEEIVAVDDDNVCTAPIMEDKGILKLVQSSKNIIDADSNDENETNDTANVPTSTELRNIMKGMRNDLGAHFNGEMNSKMDVFEQFVDNLMLKKTMQNRFAKVATTNGVEVSVPALTLMSSNSFKIN